MARATIVVLCFLLWCPLATSQEVPPQSLRCREALQRCKESPSQCLAALESYCGELGKVEAEADSLRAQLAKESEQLKKTEDELIQCNRERPLPEQKAKLENEISALRTEESQLKSNIAMLKGTRAGLLVRVEELRGLKGVFENPDARGRAAGILGLIKGERRPETVSYVEDGRRHLVTDLVLGTLKASYDSKITAGKPTQLTLDFEPHSVLSGKVLGDFAPDDMVMKWHVRPEYRALRVGSQYDYDQSGRKAEQRVLDLRGNKNETWVWTITGHEGFEQDINDLVFYMGYTLAESGTTESDVWRQKVEWKEKYVPGILDRAWTWPKGVLTWTLGALVALLTAIASWQTIKLRRLEIDIAKTRVAP
jgi:hypothetical protein